MTWLRLKNGSSWVWDRNQLFWSYSGSFHLTMPSVFGWFNSAFLLHILEKECVIDQFSVTRMPFVFTCNALFYFSTSLDVLYVCFILATESILFFTLQSKFFVSILLLIAFLFYFLIFTWLYNWITFYLYLPYEIWFFFQNAFYIYLPCPFHSH